MCCLSSFFIVFVLFNIGITTCDEILSVNSSLSLSGSIFTSSYDTNSRLAYVATRDLSRNTSTYYKIDVSTPTPTTTNSVSLTLVNPLQVSVLDTQNNFFYLFSSVLGSLTIVRVNTTTSSYSNITISGYDFASINAAYLDQNRSLIYLVGSPQGENYLGKIDTTNPFTNEGWYIESRELRDDRNISLNGSAIASVIDFSTGIGIFATDNADRSQVIRVDLLNTPYEDFYIAENSILLDGGLIKGSLTLPNHNLIFFYDQPSDQNFNTTIYAVFYNLTVRDYKSLALPYNNVNIRVQTGTLDPIARRAYLGCGLPIAPIFMVDLDSLEMIGTPIAPSDSSFLYSFIDLASFSAYFCTDADDHQFYKISIPPSCPNNCSSHGNCSQDGVCICREAQSHVSYTQPDCRLTGCYDDCNFAKGQGVCTPLLGEVGVCNCTQTYSGESCNERGCSSKCEEHGRCINFTCVCDDYYSGPDCARQAAACYELLDCDQCQSNSSCGWCRTSGKCVEGDATGPNDAACLSYFYNQCPEFGMEFWAYLFSGIALVLFIINMVSIYVEDRDYPKSLHHISDILIKSSWWRNQRSAKAWALLDQVQFAVITAQFAVVSPSLYLNFVSIYRWSVFGFSLPWSIRKSADPTRDLLSMEQFSSTVQSFLKELMYGSLFWFVCLVALVLFFFFVVGSINAFARSSNINKFVRNRTIHSMVRLFIFFGYWPFVIYTTFTISLGITSVAPFVIALVLFVIFVLGSHAILYKILPITRNPPKKIFEPQFLKKFGCLYNSYYINKSYYLHIILIKKLLMGGVVGLIRNQLAQMIVLVSIQAVYVVQLFIMKPYLDRIHTYLDIANSICNLIVIGLMFGFLDSVNISPSGSLVVSALACAMLLLSQFFCVVVYVNSWLKLRKIYTFSSFFNCCRGIREEDLLDVTEIELAQKRH